MLLDTHIWIRLIVGSPQLRQELKDHIDQNRDACLLSPVSIWEALLLAKKGRLQLGKSPEATLRRALRLAPIPEAPLNLEIAFMSRSLRFQHEDPADRFIAATAKFYGVPLATDDQDLRRLSWLKTV